MKENNIIVEKSKSFACCAARLCHGILHGSLRQFRNHYLPKTFSILESYARMERMGVEGGNIGSAMKDVEAIMDKLVLGFEKQLDALYGAEALDISTDITVLETMMAQEGLTGPEMKAQTIPNETDIRLEL